MRRGGTIIVLWLAVWLGSHAVAMDMAIRMDSLSPRSNAPIPVTITFAGGQALMEGRLTIELWQGKHRFIHFQSEAITLASADYERRFLLPAIPQKASRTGQAEWRLTFESAQARFHKKGIYVTVPESDQRVAVVAVVHPDPEKPPLALRDWLGNGDLETQMGVEGPDNIRAGAFNRIITWKAPLLPPHLPGQALALCAYDIVALTPESLSLLSGFQTDALTTWVRAGGSLVILRHPDRPVASTTAMNGLLEKVSEQGRPVSILTEDVQTKLGTQLQAWQWDLGRTVMLHGLTTETDVDHSAWQDVFRFLWNVRDLNEVDASVVGEEDLDSGKLFTRLGDEWPVSNHLNSTLSEQLMPTGVNLLPTGQLAALMFGFLLVAGPIEHFLLRWTRRRWLTWLTFPVVLLVMTLGSFLLGDKLIGRSSIKRIELVDLSLDGQEVVRRHSMELTFGTESESTLYPHENRFMTRVIPGQEKGVTTFHQGRYPSSYGTARTIERWTPHTEQYVDLGAVAKVPLELQAIDWKAYHPRNPDAMQDLYQQVEAIDGFDALGVDSELLKQSPARTGTTFPLHTFFGSYLKHHDETSPLPFRLFISERRNTGGGMFIVTPTVGGGGATGPLVYHDKDVDTSPWVPFPRLSSPHADGVFSDWIVLDHAQWLISFKQGEQRLIYRYVYPEHD